MTVEQVAINYEGRTLNSQNPEILAFCNRYKISQLFADPKKGVTYVDPFTGRHVSVPNPLTKAVQADLNASSTPVQVPAQLTAVPLTNSFDLRAVNSASVSLGRYYGDIMSAMPLEYTIQTPESEFRDMIEKWHKTLSHLEFLSPRVFFIASDLMKSELQTMRSLLSRYDHRSPALEEFHKFLSEHLPSSSHYSEAA